MAGGLLEDSGRCMRSGQRGGQREERTATTGDTKKGSIYILKGVFNKKGHIHLKGSSLIERVVFDVIKGIL